MFINESSFKRMKINLSTSAADGFPKVSMVGSVSLL
jgi:hypothetical protein